MRVVVVIGVITSLLSLGCDKMSPKEASGLLYHITSKPYPGELKYVRKYLASGARPDYVPKTSVSGNTPLLNASGAFGKDRGNYSGTGLKDSAEIEAVKIVKYLVSKGADLHATDSSANRRNALHLAAIGGRPRMIHALVELGMDINSRDRMNITPLIQAAGSGCIEAVKACVELGADINARMNGPRTALDAAYEFGTEEAYKWGKVICKDHQDIIVYLKKHGARRAAEFSE